MHTSTMLTPTDFEYERAGSRVAFDDVFTDYHPLDRTAVAWSHSTRAVLETNLAVLALTTAFYESLRRRHAGEFFDYPQHFSLGVGPVGMDSADFPSGGAWSMLDVWPECKRKLIPGRGHEMFTAVFDLQVNRILWPMSWWVGANAWPDGDLPGHIHKMLHTSLKQVLVYRDEDSSAAQSLFERSSDGTVYRISGTRAVATVLEGVYPHLPESRRPAPSDAPLVREYLAVSPAEFLSRYERCFAT